MLKITNVIVILIKYLPIPDEQNVVCLCLSIGSHVSAMYKFSIITDEKTIPAIDIVAVGI